MGKDSAVMLHLARKAKESIWVFPISRWTELDIRQYVHLNGTEIVPLYFSAPRPTVKRDGLLLMVDDERFRLKPDEVPVERSIRFRTLGCYPLTGAVESLIAEDIDAYLKPHQHIEPAPLHHLRIGRRRQVHPDRAAANRETRFSC